MAYFGAGSVFAARQMTDGAACTTAAFGDPLPNVVKYCLTSALPQQETECAPEGGSCAVSGQALMLYGANGVYSAKVVEQTTACSNDVFGDPVPNVAKSCLLLHAPAPLSPPPPPVQTAPRAAVRSRRIPPPRQPAQITYATLELPSENNPVSGYVAANADGTLALNANEFMAVFFAISGNNSPPGSEDMVRLGDSAGKLVLKNRSDGNLTMQAGAIAAGAQYQVRRLDNITGQMANGALFALQAQPDGRMIKFDNGALKLFSVPADGSSLAYSILRIHLHTQGQIDELQAQRTASENVSAPPQLRRGN